MAVCPVVYCNWIMSIDYYPKRNGNYVTQVTSETCSIGNHSIGVDMGGDSRIHLMRGFPVVYSAYGVELNIKRSPVLTHPCPWVDLSS